MLKCKQWIFNHCIVDTFTLQNIVKMDEYTGMIRVAGVIDRSTYDFISFVVRVSDVNISTSQTAQTATGMLMLDIQILFI